jgi:hypothetical protein
MGNEARKTLNQLRADGVPVQEVPVNVEEMIVWCAARGESVNGSRRTAYITEVLRNTSTQSGNR